MMRLTPASRVFVLAAGLVISSVTMATAEEAPPADAPPAEEPFKATVYFGPGFGFADQVDTEFGWAFWTLMRPIEYLGIQIEYLNVGSQPPPDTSGERDGAYFGLAGMFPAMPRLDIYGQAGLAVGDAGDDVAAGGGVMYGLPIAWLDKNNVDLTLRLDYKWINWDDGDHLITLGIMFGLHK